jgi:hypothetical protein
VDSDHAIAAAFTVFVTSSAPRPETPVARGGEPDPQGGRCTDGTEVRYAVSPSDMARCDRTRRVAFQTLERNLEFKHRRHGRVIGSDLLGPLVGVLTHRRQLVPEVDVTVHDRQTPSIVRSERKQFL